MTRYLVFLPARPLRSWMAGMVLMAILSLPEATYADLGSDLESFFNDLNFSNVTNPGAYQGQAAGYFTGGGVMLRVPQRSYNLYAVQWPKFRAGCGGIDFYTGGFSFINSDELIALLKNIGSTAVSQAFLLALRTLSPQIASTMEQLQSWAQKFNFDTIQACEAGRTLVSGALEHFGREDFACAMALTDAGTHSWAEARKACQHEVARDTTVNGSPAGSVGDQVALNGNIAWRALMHNDFFRKDKDLAQVMMNLSGTVIISPAGAGVSGPSYVALPSMLSDSQGRRLLDAMLQGGSVRIRACDTTTDEKACTDISGNKTITIEKGGLIERVARILRAISDHIKTDTPLDAEQQGLLQTTPLPVHKYLTVQRAFFASDAAIDKEIDLYSTLIAKDLLYAYLSDVLGKMMAGTTPLQNGTDERVKHLREGIREARQAIQRHHDELNTKFGEELELTRRARDYERAVLSHLSPGMLKVVMRAAAHGNRY